MRSPGHRGDDTQKNTALQMRVWRARSKSGLLEDRGRRPGGLLVIELPGPGRWRRWLPIGKELLYLLLGETFAAKVGQVRQSRLLQHCVQLFQGSLCHVPDT